MKKTPPLLKIALSITGVLAFLLIWQFSLGSEMQQKATTSTNAPQESVTQFENTSDTFNSNGPISLSLELVETPSGVGERGEISVVLDSSDPLQVIDGAEFIVTFDTTQLSNVSIEPSDLFSEIFVETVDTESGQIQFVALRQATEEIIISDQTNVATISFEAAQPGTASLVFDRDNTLVVGNQGDSLLRQVVDLTLEVE